MTVSEPWDGLPMVDWTDAEPGETCAFFERHGCHAQMCEPGIASCCYVGVIDAAGRPTVDPESVSRALAALEVERDQARAWVMALEARLDEVRATAVAFNSTIGTLAHLLLLIDSPLGDVG